MRRLAPLKDLGALLKHLRLHSVDTLMSKWLSNFQRSLKKKGDGFILSTHEFKLAKFFITANLGLSQLGNPCLRDLLEKEAKPTTYHKFRNVILPDIMSKFQNFVDTKLLRAQSVSLIIDIWTNRINADFLGVGAVLSYANFESELIVIGMDRMTGGHCAENIGLVLEKVVNVYKFDKTKIISIICDEASSLSRLIGQLDDHMFDEIVEETVQAEIMTLDKIITNVEEVTAEDETAEDETTPEVTAEDETTQEETAQKEVVEEEVIESQAAQTEYDEVPTIQSLNNEIVACVNDVTEMEFDKPIKVMKIVDDNIIMLDGDSENLPVTYLSMTIGSNAIPRFNCACHKLNLAIRWAINNHNETKSMLNDISSANSSVLRIIRVSHTFRLKKCRLRTQNLTRWSSAYLMLESVKRAFDR